MSDKPDSSLVSLDDALAILLQQEARIRALEARNTQLSLALALYQYQYRRPRGWPKAKKVEPEKRAPGRPSSWKAGFVKKIYEAVIAEKGRAHSKTKHAIEAVIRPLMPHAREHEIRCDVSAIEKLISRYKKSQTKE